MPVVTLAMAALVALATSPVSSAPDRPSEPTRPASIPRTNPPSNLKPLIKPAVSKEGVWVKTGRLNQGYLVTKKTFLRPAPGVYAQVLWIDPKVGQFRLYAGSSDPGGSGWRYQSWVTGASRPILAAAFNSGFMVSDGASKGGFFAYGRYGRSLVKGAASVVLFKDGSVNVGSWAPPGFTMASNVAAVRQTLKLMIAVGRSCPPSTGRTELGCNPLSRRLHVAQRYRG